MRTVLIIRQAADAEFEDFLGDFVGSGDTGLIHARTAIAIASLEGADVRKEEKWKEEIECKGVVEADSARLWKIAARHLSGVRREVDYNKALDEARTFGFIVPDGSISSALKSGVDERSAADSSGYMLLDGGAEQGKNLS
jgi:hypothetical protein